MVGLEVVVLELVEAEVVEVVEEVVVVEVVGWWGVCGGARGGGGGVSMDAKVPTSVHKQCVSNHGIVQPVPHRPRVSSHRQESAPRPSLARPAANPRCLPIG